MENFPSNAHTPKRKPEEDPELQPKKRVERVVEGEVIRRKKPLGKRFMETFFGGESRGVWGFIVEDVLVPAAKDMVRDAVTQGIERKLYGTVRTGRGTNRPSGSSAGHISYNRFGGNAVPVTTRREDPRPSMSRIARSTHDFGEIILATRVEAEEVIDRLFELISKYESATVNDLYEMVGITGNYTDTKYGWTNLQGSRAVHVRDGYLLELPRPVPLD